MGVNYALFEEAIFDRVTGRQVNPDMEFYKLGGIQDMPQIYVHMMDMPERGVIGIGEPPTISTAAAVGNAVFNAIGVRVPQAPFTPERVLAALANRQTINHRLAAVRRTARFCEPRLNAKYKEPLHMKNFTYFRPASAEQAVALLEKLGQHRDARAAAPICTTCKRNTSPSRQGRQPQRHRRSRHDPGRRQGGSHRRRRQAGRHRRAPRLKELFPALTIAAGEIGGPQIRNMGTLGGNLCQRNRCWYFRDEHVNCLLKGGQRCFALDGEKNTTPSSARATAASSSIPRRWPPA